MIGQPQVWEVGAVQGILDGAGERVGQAARGHMPADTTAIGMQIDADGTAEETSSNTLATDKPNLRM